MKTEFEEVDEKETVMVYEKVMDDGAVYTG